MKMVNPERSINVGLGKIAIAQPPDVLTSIGIGSCVVLCLYYDETHTAGMAHIMLPGGDENHSNAEMPAKYADTAVENLLSEFHKKNIRDVRKIKAKIIGGAQLFRFKQVPNIGEKNIEAVRKALRRRGIRITGEDVGGNFGRSVWFFADSGKVVIKSREGETVLI